MMERANLAKTVLTGAIGAVSTVLGWFGWLWIVFLTCLTLDFITGTVAAGREGEWRSQLSRDGIWSKLGTVVAVVVAGIADLTFGLILNNLPGIQLPFQYAVLLCPLVMVWYIFTEMGSIIENAGRLGAPIPPFLARTIAILRATVDSTGNALLEDRDSNQKIEKR